MRLLALLEAASVTGPARNLAEFARSAPSVHLHVALFQRGSARQHSGDLISHLVASGIQVHLIHEQRRYDLSVFTALRRLGDAVDPDIVQSHSVKSHWLLRWLKTCPWIAFHHGYTTTDLKVQLYNQLDRVSLRRPDRLVTVSQAFARELVRRGAPASRVVVCPNAADPDRVQASDVQIERARRWLGVAPDEALILCVGRLSHEKAHSDLVAALAGVYRDAPQLRWVAAIVGEGPERERIAMAARHAGIVTRVRLPGAVVDVAPFYRAASLFVLPSYREGSPNVLLEAAVAGLPIVATTVGGVPEMFADGTTARLVAAGDCASLAAAIQSLLADRAAAARLGEAARTHVTGEYGAAARAQRLERLYAEVLAERGDRRGHARRGAAA